MRRGTRSTLSWIASCLVRCVTRELATNGKWQRFADHLLLHLATHSTTELRGLMRTFRGLIDLNGYTEHTSVSTESVLISFYILVFCFSLITCLNFRLEGANFDDPDRHAMRQTQSTYSEPCGATDTCLCTSDRLCRYDHEN